MNLRPGDDVVVTFEGERHAGEVIHQSHGFVMCRIRIDDEGDYGSITERLAPISTVMVPEKDVKPV